MEIFLKIVKRAGLFNRDLRVTEKQSSSVIFKLTLPELIFDREGALAVQETVREKHRELDIHLFLTKLFFGNTLLKALYFYNPFILKLRVNVTIPKFSNNLWPWFSS